MLTSSERPVLFVRIVIIIYIYRGIYHIYRSQSSTSTAMPRGVVLINMLFENPEIPERPAAEHPNVFRDMSIYMYI